MTVRVRKLGYLRRLGAVVALALASLSAVQDADAQVGHDWPMFRGTPTQEGISKTRLSDALQVRWKFELEEAVTATAAIVGGVVYVAAEDGYVYALKLADGSLIWKYQAGEIIKAPPTVLDGVLYVGNDEGVMHAIDAKSGRRKWTFATDGEIISGVNYQGDRLVFGSYDGAVYCLSKINGTLLWRFETEGRVHSTPAVADGHVLVAGCDEYLRVLRLSDGKEVSKASMNSVTGASPAIVASRAIIGTYDAHVYGIEWKSGQIAWEFHDTEREFPIMSSVAVADGAVYFGGRDKRIRALDAETGKQRWVFVTKGRIDSSPVVVGRRLFVGSTDGILYALETKSGKVVWSFDSGAPFSASPAVADGALVIGNEDGVVYCFSARTKTGR